MSHSKLGYVVCGAIVFLSLAIASEAFELEKGYVGTELYYYPVAGAPGQKHGSVAVIGQLEVRAQINDGWSAKIAPFVRVDAVDEQRNVFDLREAELRYTGGAWTFTAGATQVSWSVTESVNVVPHQVVDIVNQRDLAGDPAGQEKLGTLAATVAHQGETVLVRGYLLPFFRERRFPDVDAREHPFQGTIDLNGDTQFVSSAGDNYVGAALRVEKAFDAANVAFIQYRGYAPQPLTMPDFSTGLATNLYYLVDMSAVTLQATAGQWILKSESGYFGTHANPARFANVPDSYVSSVSGVEYGFVRAWGESDINVMVEWMYDSRGDGAGGTAFQNDLFLGARWLANDADDTQILGGVVRDLDQRAAIFHVQYQRRIGKQLQLQMVARSFDAEDRNALHALNDDFLLHAKLRYFF